MLIQDLAKKTRLALLTVIIAVSGSVAISAFVVWTCIGMVSEERSQIYVLDGDIPFLAERARLETTYTIEAKAHIQAFHSYFFTLPPDDEYIKYTLSRAMYMADGAALRQKQALDENGFYSDIVSSSAVCSIICDSITVDEDSHKFMYYGTQTIKRRTRNIRRTLITSGSLESVPRSHNNPHGLLITGWRTIENKELAY